MNGIDVSGWQKGINIDAVPSDFVISKSTQGKTYVNDDCDRVVQACIRLGKCWGFYHYIDGSGVNGEADFFVRNCENYFGHGLPCLDWESVQNAAWGNPDYLDRLTARVIELTGVPPLIYASASVFPWDIARAHNCGAWVAQYANNGKTGYQATPWNEGAYTCVVRQYTSNGRLAGYDGALDLNKAYVTPEQWGRYANPSGAQTPQQPTQPDVDALARAVIAGDWGNGAERVQRLTAAGYDAAAVQARVNELLGAANLDAVARAVIRGDYGNGDERVQRLSAAGYDAAAVQARVNELLG